MTFLQRFTILSPYLLASVIALSVGVILWRGHKAVAGRGHFALIMLGVAAWAFFNFLEDATDQITAKIAYANLQYLFIGAVPVLFLQFALRATLEPLPRRFLRLGFRVALWAVPALVAALVWLDPVLGVVRTIHGLKAVGAFTILDKTWTPVFWVFTAYCYTLILTSLVLWGRHILRSLRTIERSEVLPFLSIFFPWAANVFFLVGFNPWPGHDPTTPLFAVMGLVLASHLNNNRFLTMLPQAQEALMQTWPAPLLVFDEKDRLRFFNQAAAERWSLGRNLVGSPRRAVLEWLPDRAVEREGLGVRVTDGGRGQVWEIEVKPLESAGRSQGRLLIFGDVSSHVQEIAVRTSALENAVGALSDVYDSKKQSEQQIFYYSLHDALTALANRSLLLSRLGQAMDLQNAEAGTPFSLIGIDLVNFKGVNDSFGHWTGDFLVRQTAIRLKAALRDTDVPARITSDRFFAILSGTNSEVVVLATVNRILGELEDPLDLGDHSYLPKFRIAVVLGDREISSAESMIDDVETTLARLKASTDERVLLFQKQWREVRLENRLLLEDLSRAFSTRQISLVYQPIVDARDNRLLGMEALMRWNHPSKGLISPSRFVALAEAEGLISPLGLWALREATGFLARTTSGRTDLENLYVSVNVSPKQLIDPSFRSVVFALLDHSGLSPSRLHLEITETSLVTNPGQVVPQLEALRKVGVKVKLDDFGTGYSSLQSLHELPVDTIKIDRSFMVKLPHSRPIVLTVVELARKLGMDTIAEGVETGAQLRQLTDLGCWQIQGHLFAMGLTEKEMAGHLGRADGLVFLPRDLPG